MMQSPTWVLLTSLPAASLHRSRQIKILLIGRWERWPAPTGKPCGRELARLAQPGQRERPVRLAQRERMARRVLQVRLAQRVRQVIKALPAQQVQLVHRARKVMQVRKGRRVPKARLA